MTAWPSRETHRRACPLSPHAPSWALKIKLQPFASIQLSKGSSFHIKVQTLQKRKKGRKKHRWPAARPGPIGAREAGCVRGPSAGGSSCGTGGRGPPRPQRRASGEGEDGGRGPASQPGALCPGSARVCSKSWAPNTSSIC